MIGKAITQEKVGVYMLTLRKCNCINIDRTYERDKLSSRIFVFNLWFCPQLRKKMTKVFRKLHDEEIFLKIFI